jgi:hypothetical protein
MLGARWQPLLQRGCCTLWGKQGGQITCSCCGVAIVSLFGVATGFLALLSSAAVVAHSLGVCGVKQIQARNGAVYQEQAIGSALWYSEMQDQCTSDHDSSRWHHV